MVDVDLLFQVFDIIAITKCTTVQYDKFPRKNNFIFYNYIVFFLNSFLINIFISVSLLSKGLTTYYICQLKMYYL